MVVHGEFIFGLGLGLFFAGLLIAATPDISNSEIERRARDLGMVHRDEVFDFESDTGEVSGEKDLEPLEPVKVPPKASPEVTEPEVEPGELLNLPQNSDRSLSVTIFPGSTLSEVGDQLEEAGIIENEEEFLEFFKSQGLSNKLRVGTYELKVNEDFDQLAKILCGKGGSGH